MLAKRESKESQFFATCPYCEALIVLDFRRIRWCNDDPASAVYICQKCGEEITDKDKISMLKVENSREINLEDLSETMRLPSNKLYSKDVGFSDVVREFLSSMNDLKKMQDFAASYSSESQPKTTKK